MTTLLEDSDHLIETGLLPNKNHGSRLGMLDFQQIYYYYYQKGFHNIILLQLTNLVTTSFTMLLTYFLVFRLRYRAIFYHINQHQELTLETLIRDNPVRWYEILTLIAMSVVIVVQVIYYLSKWPTWWLIRKLFHDLGFRTNQLERLPWERIVPSLMRKTKQSANEITSEIMMRDNYLIAIIAERLLESPSQHRLLEWLGIYNTTLFYSRSLEWILDHLVLDVIFQSNLIMRGNYHDSVTNRESLIKKIRWRLYCLSFLSFLMSPVIIVAILIYCFFRYTEEIRSNPESTVVSRQWTRYARYKFRCYHELLHSYENRLNMAMPMMNTYLKQFYSRSLQIIFRAVVFILTSFVAILLLMAVVNENLLINRTLATKSLLWWLTCFGVIISLLRGSYPNRYAVFDPWTPLKQVKNYINLPNGWLLEAHDETIQQEISSYFQPRGLLFLEEIGAVLLLPYLMGFYLPGCLDRLVHFILDNTVWTPKGPFYLTSLDLRSMRNGSRSIDSEDQRMSDLLKGDLDKITESNYRLQQFESSIIPETGLLN